MILGISKALRRRKALDMIDRVRKQKLTYLSDSKLRTLVDLVLDVQTKRLPGAILEAGCALGGSSIVIAAAKQSDRPFRIYDVFDMIPPPSNMDEADVHERYKIIASGQSQGIGGDKYYGYLSDIYARVTNSFAANGIPLADNNVSLIKGLVQDTLHPDGPICLAHIDVDWYEPVMTCLTRIEPKLPAGGAIVLDDYGDWSGCRKATDEYFADKRDRFHFDMSPGSLVVRKLR